MVGGGKKRGRDPSLQWMDGASITELPNSCSPPSSHHRLKKALKIHLVPLIQTRQSSVILKIRSDFKSHIYESMNNERRS